MRAAKTRAAPRCSRRSARRRGTGTEPGRPDAAPLGEFASGVLELRPYGCSISPRSVHSLGVINDTSKFAAHAAMAALAAAFMFGTAGVGEAAKKKAEKGPSKAEWCNFEYKPVCGMIGGKKRTFSECLLGQARGRQEDQRPAPASNHAGIRPESAELRARRWLVLCVAVSLRRRDLQKLRELLLAERRIEEFQLHGVRHRAVEIGHLVGLHRGLRVKLLQRLLRGCRPAASPSRNTSAAPSGRHTSSPPPRGSLSRSA